MPDPAPLPGAGKRILIVDADPLVRDQVAATLGDLGLHIEEAASTLAAVAAAVRQKPDLVLLDLHLSGEREGVTLCRKLRSTPAFQDLPILFLTGERDKALILEAIQAGASDVILKHSYSKNLLLAKVGKLLGVSLVSATAETAGWGRPWEEKGTAGRERPAGRPPTREEIRKAVQEAAEVRTLPHVATEVLRLSMQSNTDVKALRAII